VQTLTSNSALSAWHFAAGPCTFVPTMGALHEGHASLIRQGSKLAKDRGFSGGCVVSIFVNPTQFNDPKDLDRYPRTLEADLAICKASGASAVYAPGVDDIYPPASPIPTPALPQVATTPGLEDAHRPGHFAGVIQVVHRLFSLVRPTAAIFGEKDWQQLQVIRAMTLRDLPSIEIIPGETIRESDGLAMSSRNRFLSAQDRERGLSLSRALRAASLERTPDAAESAMRQILTSGGVEIEYAVVREAHSLLRTASNPSTTPWRALIAARVGPVRLIDNMPWPAA
jgi:pantoate--beta-alanine ligase